MGNARPAEARFLLSLAMLAVYKQCELQDHTCAIRIWTQRAADLAAAISRTSSRPVAVDIISGCTASDRPDALGLRAPGAGRTAADGAVEWPAAPGVVIRRHAAIPPAAEPILTNAAWEYDAWGVPSGRRIGKPATILKWLGVSLVHAEYAAVFDLDTNPLPPTIRPRLDAAAADWHVALRRMRARGIWQASMPLKRTPIWGGFFVVRTSTELYEEGLRVLTHAGELFNATHGWGLAGPPQAVIPRSDVLWSVRTPYSYFLHKSRAQGGDMWTFNNAPIEEGFMLYFYRVRRAYPFGIELGELPSAPEPSTFELRHDIGKPWLRRWTPQLEACAAIAAAEPGARGGGAAARTAAGLPELWTFPRDVRETTRVYAWHRLALRDLDGWAGRDASLPSVLNASARAACARVWRAASSCIRRTAVATNKPQLSARLDTRDAQLIQEGGDRVFEYVPRESRGGLREGPLDPKVAAKRQRQRAREARIRHRRGPSPG